MQILSRINYLQLNWRLYNKTQGCQTINFGGSTTFADNTILGLATGAYTFTVACNGGTAAYTFNATQQLLQ